MILDVVAVYSNPLRWESRLRHEWGLWELAGNKPKLRHEISRYFRQRDEDANSGCVAP